MPFRIQNAHARNCYTFTVVGYVKLGRKIGIGTRIAAKILREKTQSATAPSPAQSTAPKTPPRPDGAASRVNDRRAKARETGMAARNLGRGVARGGTGFWKSVARIVHALWHQITGVFFAIFSLFFFESAWKFRSAWHAGAQHLHFIVYLAIAVLFAYFSVTAFVTARHKK